MRKIYRSRKNQADIPRGAAVVYIEEWATIAALAFLALFVALVFACLKVGELVGYPQNTWPTTLKDALLFANATLACLFAWRMAGKLVKPFKLKQTRGAVLHEDDRVGGDGFKAMKTFLDDELKSQPGKAAPLLLAAPQGVNILAAPEADKKRTTDICAPLSDDRSRTHMLFVGSTGSGKSLSIKPPLQLAIRAGHKLVILDKKGEYTEEIEEKRIALFGLHDRRQLQWHIARDLRTTPDAQQFLVGLIPVDASQPYWGTSARLIGTALLAHLIHTKPGTWTLKDFEELCAVPPEEMSPLVRLAYSEAETILQGEGQALTSVLGNLAAFTAPLKTFGKEWDGSDYPLFSLSDWLKDPTPSKNVLIFQSGGSYSSLNDPLIRGCLTYMASYIDSPMFKRDSVEAPRSLWFFCDEFQSFGKLDTFTKILLERGRDKGARVVIGVQDVSQLNETYGQDFVKFLMSNVGMTALAGANQGETAEMFSRLIGKRSFVKTHVSTSENGKTTNEQEHEEDVLTTSEIIGKLGFKDGCTRVLYRFTRSPDAYIVHQPLIKYPRITEPTVEADWVLGIKRSSPVAVVAPTPIEPDTAAAGGAKQSPAPRQMLDEELPAEIDDLPDDYESYAHDMEDDEDAYCLPEIDELAAPVAALSGASGIEHAISIIDLLAEHKPRFKDARPVSVVAKELRLPVQTRQLDNTR